MKIVRLSALAFYRLLIGLTASGVLLTAGCADGPHADVQQAVEIDSTPGHADIFIDKAPLHMTTPATVMLQRQYDTHLVITKPGFVPADVYVHEQAGELIPNPVNVELRTELLPDKRGPNPPAEMAACLENLRKYIAAGTISPDDEAYVEKQIRDFYK